MKNLFPLQFVKSVWFLSIWFYICVLKVVFLSKNIVFSCNITLIDEKNEKKKFSPKLANCIFAITSFDLWMSKGVHDIFAFVINFFGFD